MADNRITVRIEGHSELGPVRIEHTVTADRLPALTAALFSASAPRVSEPERVSEAERYIQARRPAGFPQTIALAARYLLDERGFDSVTRADLRDVLRAAPSVRMPKNFNRDFSLAVEKGLLEDLGDGRRFTLGDGPEWYV